MAAGPLVPFNHARPKRGLIHQVRPLLYLQATMAGLKVEVYLGNSFNIFQNCHDFVYPKDLRPNVFCRNLKAKMKSLLRRFGLNIYLDYDFIIHNT